MEVLYKLDDVPGNLREISRGFVWVHEGRIQGWSMSPTRDVCEHVVLEVVNRLGLDIAFGE